MDTSTRKFLGCEQSQDVPNNDTAKLMFYLNAVSQVLDLPNERKFGILTDYQRYYRLSDEDIDRLVLYSVMFNPEILLNKCIFENDKVCEKNKFVISNKASVHVAESIYIGGKVRYVSNVMIIGSRFIKTYYTKPMKFFVSRRERLFNKYQLNKHKNVIPSSGTNKCQFCVLL